MNAMVRSGRGAPEETLTVGQPHGDEGFEVRLLGDADRDAVGAQRGGDPREALQRPLHAAVRSDADDVAAIDLDDVGFDDDQTLQRAAADTTRRQAAATFPSSLNFEP